MNKLQTFVTWANAEGHDTAYTYDTDRSRWVILNPMTADLWKAWQAALEAGRAQQSEPIDAASRGWLAALSDAYHSVTSEHTKGKLKEVLAYLAAPQAEPVAWRWVPSQTWGGYVYTDDKAKADYACRFVTVESLHTAPQPERSTHVPPPAVQCGKGCACLAQCGDVYAHAGLAAPQPALREPLTEDQAMRVLVNACDSLNITRVHEPGGKTMTICDEAGLMEIARAIERAHGIGLEAVE